MTCNLGNPQKSDEVTTAAGPTAVSGFWKRLKKSGKIWGKLAAGRYARAFVRAQKLVRSLTHFFSEAKRARRRAKEASRRAKEPGARPF